jgi:rhodanese-related sulfurtransferase
MSISLLFTAALFACGAVALANAASNESIPRITKEEAKAMLGSPELVVVDVRKPSDWDAAEHKIPGAQRREPAKVAQWMNDFSRDKTLVLYCS